MLRPGLGLRRWNFPSLPTRCPRFPPRPRRQSALETVGRSYVAGRSALREPVRLSALAVVLALLQACGGGGGSSGSSGGDPDRPGSQLENIEPFVADGPYSAVLKPCVTVESAEDSCPLDDLPLLGMVVGTPDIDSVVQRLLVSHDWMGANFEQALDVLPAEILRLMRGVTAVVIDDNTRPSYYDTRTGAIHLDPASLWLTNPEKATVGTQQDYRSGFGAELAFRSLARHVKNGDYAYDYYPLNGSEERAIADILYPLAGILLHELAHANDFFPPAALGSLDPNLTLVEASAILSGERISRQLADWMPLTSDTMLALARVMYHGESATDAQKAITAVEVGGIFEADVASDDYAHSSIYEDTAMLFEEAMMKYHFDIDRDIAYTPAPSDPTFCSAYVVAWGYRNRFGDPDVKVRAQFVVSSLLPDGDFDAFFQGMALPTPMQNGVDWCSNLQLGGQQQLLSGGGYRRG